LTESFAVNHFFIVDLFNSIASTVPGSKSFRCCEKKFLRARNGPRYILTSLSPNPAWPENPGPTYNSDVARRFRTDLRSNCKTHSEKSAQTYSYV